MDFKCIFSRSLSSKGKLAKYFYFHWLEVKKKKILTEKKQNICNVYYLCDIKDINKFFFKNELRIHTSISAVIPRHEEDRTENGGQRKQ